MSANTLFSDVNELYLAYILNGQSWKGNLGIAAQTQYDKRVDELNKTTKGQQERQRAIGQAKAMAKAVLDYAHNHGYGGNPTEVYWTARSGFSFTDIDDRWEAVSKDNPADVLVKFPRSNFTKSISGNYLGISMKALKKTSGDAPVKNPGVKKIAKFIGKSESFFSDIIEQGADEVHNQLGTLKKKKLLDKPAVKAITKKDEAYQTLESIKDKYLSQCRDALLDGFKSKDDGEVMLYILQDLLDTDRLPKYVKVTGYGNYNQTNTARVENPTGQENEKFKALMDDTAKFSYESAGGDTGYSFGVKKGTKRIIRVRFKFESAPFASALKMSIEPWATPISQAENKAAKIKTETVIG